MDKLNDIHVKLMSFKLHSLSQISSSSSSSSSSSKSVVSFSLNGHSVSRAEIVGVVVSRDLKPDQFLKFSIDDGTGCVQCVLWLNHRNSLYFSRRDPLNVRISANVATNFANQVKLGLVLRVRGKITSYRGAVQITVSDIVVERDPNVEILHWLDCIRLARKCYDVLPAPR